MAHSHTPAEHRQAVYRSPPWLLCTSNPPVPPARTQWPSLHIKAESLSYLLLSVPLAWGSRVDLRANITSHPPHTPPSQDPGHAHSSPSEPPRHQLLLPSSCGVILSLSFFSSRQGFFVYPWLSWNSLCRPDWPRSQRSSCLYLLRAGIKGVRHHGWLCLWFCVRVCY